MHLFLVENQFNNEKPYNIYKNNRVNKHKTKTTADYSILHEITRFVEDEIFTITHFSASSLS